MAAKTQHHHAEVLRAIADGIPIQLWHIYYQEKPMWINIDPSYYFRNCTGIAADRLRIKPEKVYPVTSYTGEELHDIYIFEDGPPETAPNAFTRLANLVIKRHVDEQESASEG